MAPVARLRPSRRGGGSPSFDPQVAQAKRKKGVAPGRESRAAIRNLVLDMRKISAVRRLMDLATPRPRRSSA